PPNNWQGMFGGTAWEWDARRRQYYLHNFLIEQPDLNVRNPDVQDALLNVARFWLDRGVDGFRLDVVNFFVQDAQLRDNPAIPHAKPPARPLQFQRHLYDRSQPETLDFIARLRALTDSYDARMMVGEIEDEEPLRRQLEYTDGPNRLHTAYSFFLLRIREATPAAFIAAMQGWEDAQGWPSWSLSNHDVPRFASRLAGDDPGRVRQLMAILLSLRGTIFLYQGDELGLPDAHVPFEKLRDPEAIRFWPKGVGRDGARTPMPWSVDGGFSRSSESWLPIDPSHTQISADAQENEPNSMLAFTRGLIALRSKLAALREGAWRALEAPAHILAYERATQDERVLCIFNMSGAPARFTHDLFADSALLPTGLAAKFENGALDLEAWGGAWLLLPGVS
ncbi:MAG: alpha-amylase family glycosyl hydrolase, partial [Hyphomonadaceae bacterium]